MTKDEVNTRMVLAVAIGSYFLGMGTEFLVRPTQKAAAVVTCPSAEAALAAAPTGSVDKAFGDLERRLDAQILRIDDHGSRLHDLEILNRAQCK